MHLPPHPETYEWSEIEGPTRSQFHTFRNAGIIKPVERRCTRGSKSALWQTHEGVAEWLEFYDDTPDYTPCGNATGIRTIQPGEYTCNDDRCDCRMDRQTAEEVLG